MTTQDDAVAAIAFTLPELLALQKTIGIALDNLGRKIARESTGGIRAAAVNDYQQLQSINEELSITLSEVIK